MGREGREREEETNCKVCSWVLVSQNRVRETLEMPQESSQLCSSPGAERKGRSPEGTSRAALEASESGEASALGWGRVGRR